MLKIYDKNHTQLGMLTRYKEPKEEAEIASGDKTLTFTVLDPDEIRLENEYYVRTQTDEYVIKKISHKSGSGLSVTCLLNLEELQGNPFFTFGVTSKTISQAAALALEGTGWSVGECDVTKIRNAGMVNCNALQVIENLSAAYMCDHSFDTIRKKVNFYKKMGARKGAYFMDGLNLKQITRETDSYDYYTRIIPVGANDLTIEEVNDGKNYLENYQYSQKALTYIWKDESYTDAQTLKEDAEEKLREMSQPAETFSCEIVDLAKQRKDFGFLDYSLGDEVKLINRETRTMVSRRITKTVRYLDEPEKNSCEISNVASTFTEMQEKLKKAAEIINYVIAKDGRYTGTISVSDILNFEEGLQNSGIAQQINHSLSETNETVQQMLQDSQELQAQMEETNAAMQAQMQEMATALQVQMQEAKEDLETQVTALQNQAQEAWEDLETQMEELDGKVQEIQGLTQLGETVTQLKGKVESLETNIDLWDENIESIETDITQLEQKAEAIEETINRIVEALKNVISDAGEVQT